MTPRFSIIVTDPNRPGWERDITDDIRSRLISITITDQMGEQNDRLTITIDDREEEGRVVRLPGKGFQFFVRMGYDRTDSPLYGMSLNGLFPMGRFTLDELEIEKDDGGRQISMIAHAVDMSANAFKEQHTETYQGMTVAEIVDAVAKRCDMTAVVSEEVASEKVESITQSAQSNSFFIHTLAKMHNCIAKVHDGKLFVCPEKEFQNLQDSSQSEVIVDEGDTSSWRYLTQGRTHCTGVKATWRDMDTGETGTVIEYPDKTKTSVEWGGEEEVFFTIPTTFANETGAKIQAKARANAMIRSQDSLTFETIGNPTIMAGGIVTLESFREEVPTEWRVVGVTHTFTDDGFSSSADCQLTTNPSPKPKARKKKPKTRF